MTAGRSLASSPAEQQRLALVEQWAVAGEDGLPELLGMLDDPSWSVRRSVVAALAQLGAPAVGPLCACLRTRRDDEARIAAAVDALVQTEADVTSELAALARDADPAVVADAAQILGRRRSARSIPLLSPLVTHADDNVAVAAIEALGRIGGPGAVETLILAVQSGNFFRVFPAIDVLGRSGDPRAIAPLGALLANPMHQLEAARALGKTAQAAAVAPLATLLSRPGEAMLRVATLALAELHTRHRERYGSDEAPAAVLRKTGLGPAAVPRLIRSLSSASPEEREATAVILGVIGGETAAGALSALLDPSDTPAAAAAAAALERLGRDSDLHVGEALRSGDSSRRRVLLPIVARSNIAADVATCLADPDAQVRSLACDALARIGAAEQAQALIPLLGDASARVAQSAIGALQSLGSAETQRLVLDGVRTAEPGVRRHALRILGYWGIPEALPLFVEAVDGADPRLAEVALSGLAYLDAPAALEALLTATQSAREGVRRHAVRALGQCTLENARVGARLLEALTDPDAWVRYYACQSAGKLRLADATSAIVQRLADDAGQVRVAAVEALSQLQNDVALDALSQLADSEDPDLRRAALIGLGMSKRSEAVGRLLAAAESEDPATRLVAVSSLAEQPGSERLAALGRAARDVDENVRVATLGFLSTDPAPEATALLLRLALDAADPGRILALLARPSDGRIQGLTADLGTADEEEANLRCSLLARLRSPEALRALLQILREGELLARKAAAVALGSLRTSEAGAALERAAAGDPDARVRQICAILTGH